MIEQADALTERWRAKAALFRGKGNETGLGATPILNLLERARGSPSSIGVGSGSRRPQLQVLPDMVGIPVPI
jgi:hypothetical protein